MGRPHFSANVPYVEDIDELRLHVINEINRLAGVTSDQTFYSDVSANNNRLKELANPAGEYDAVNLHTLRREIDKAMKELYAKLHRPNLGKAFRYNDEEFEVVPGGFTIKGVDMTKAFNFDTDIFGNAVDFTILNEAIKEDHIAAGAVTTLKLTTQEINIGYGGNDMPVRLRIYDTANNPIAWIGDDSANHGGDTDYVGAWFKRVLFGGDGTMANMKAFADANGNFVLKSVWVYDALGTVGWIGHRKLTASPYTDYYGGWFKELYVGGSWSDTVGPTNSPLYVNNAGDLYITDGTIQIAGNNTTVKINTSDGFKIETDSGDWLQMTNGTLYMQDTGSTLGSTKFAKVEPEQVACINGLYYGNPIGSAMDSSAGYGVVKVSNGLGQVRAAIIADVSGAYGCGGLFLQNAGAPGTPVWSGYCVLGAGSGIPKWYDATNSAWQTIARLEQSQTFTANQTFPTVTVQTSLMPDSDGGATIGSTSTKFSTIATTGIACSGGIGCTGLNIYTSYPSSYVNVIGSSGEIKPRYFSASSRPTLTDGEGAFWWDSANSKFYWLARVGSNYFKVEMATA